MNITKKRANEILDKYSKDKALFNWCNEYDTWVNNQVALCVSNEWEYIIKKSYEDQEAPFSYEDLDLFDIDIAIEKILQKFEDLSDEEEQEFLNKINNELTSNHDKKIALKQLEKYLYDQDKDSLKAICELVDINTYECQTEIYQWFILNSELQHELKQQGQIFLNNAWGRTCFGQSVSLDHCVITAFINILKRIVEY